MTLVRLIVEMAPITRVAISAKADQRLVTIKGEVAEIFGDRFVMQDGSGRALAETGPGGEGGKLLASNEIVTVQSRFDEGFLHGSYHIHGNERTEALASVSAPPHHGPLDVLSA